MGIGGVGDISKTDIPKIDTPIDSPVCRDGPLLNDSPLSRDGPLPDDGPSAADLAWGAISEPSLKSKGVR